MAIVSIFSGSFCRGEEIAEQVAKALDSQIIDELLISETSREFGIPDKKLRQTLQGEIPALNKFTREREKNIASLKAVLSKLILDDNRVIHGPAVHLLSRNIAHILRVCIIADMPYRVKQAVAALSIPKGKAEGLIRNYDRKMKQWTDYLIGSSPYDSKIYDIVIPIHDTPVDQALQIIEKHATGEQLATTQRSKKAADDFRLSTQVNLALTKEGYDIDVFSENGEITLLIDHDVIRMKQHQEKLIKIARNIEGVSGVNVRPGPKFHTASTNPWANIELPPKILLVDDEKEFVQTLSERLQTRNLESSIVYDGEQALEFVDKNQTDVMVLDLMMPGINGIEVLRRVKKEYPKVEVIILTGHGSEKERAVSEELGAFAYLQKPVDIDVLAKVMRDAYQKINRLKEEGTDKSDIQQE